ncbi:MAG: adenosylcobalamin-dependent ribonucleoside-diphosphate reductase [Candidatus Mycalebacterium zealandia]|nr:MAG: adenosylcobalamin-dependent ribonucleoside-diphosphate reductase [Candidatus Mycalebacterium zealandia]
MSLEKTGNGVTGKENGNIFELPKKSIPDDTVFRNEEKPDSPRLVVNEQTEEDLPKETIEAFGGDELRARVFYEKYALKDEDGTTVETLPEQMWKRVATEMASPEKTKELREEWTEKFNWLLSNFRFVPGGRILFGAGQTRRSTLLNCYFMPIKKDSIEGIFEWCKEAARTYSFGGGVGTDISVLRPKGAPVNNSAIHSTGAVSFMELLSTTTGTIGQAGRRGALMITIDVNHPDILDFLDIKNDQDRSQVKFANISVKVSDEFMKAVEEDGDFDLEYENKKVRMRKTVKAREIWKRLVKSAWASAEPGLIFWDAVKRYSPTEYGGMEVEGVNPCSEQALENYGNCCLGNINLSMFVKDEFTDDACVDWGNLDRSLSYSVRFLDNILDYNEKKHPLTFQTEASKLSRRIGVGFTGFGDMAAKLGKKYDSDEAIEFTDELFSHIKNTVYMSSAKLAEEKGTFPAYDPEKHFKSPFLDSLDTEVLEKAKQSGLRNACILTVPPVGSGSVLAGTSSGIEPIFALSYFRRSESLSKEQFKVYHPLVGSYMDTFNLSGEEDLPETFVTSHEIKPEFRVRMQATIQKHIDSCISSTVNLPNDISLEDVEKIYFQSWKTGCKGVTIYREGSREGILITEQQEQENKKNRDGEIPQATHPNLTSSLHPSKISAAEKKERPQVLKGFTEVVRTGHGNLYVTVNTVDEKPFEVFVQIGKSGYTTMADAEAIGRLASLGLRAGIEAKQIVEQLEGIGGASPVFSEGKLVMSIADAVAAVLKKHFCDGEDKVATQQFKDLSSHCPECDSASLAFESGCVTCRSCGYSKCG